MNAAAPGSISCEDRAELLRIARIALKQWLLYGNGPVGSPHRESLLAPHRAFVALHVDGKLRGCVGRLDADTPLYRAVIDLTIGAATRDARYEAVRCDEVKATKIEISVLSPPVPMSDPRQIEIGRHGLIVRRGPLRGLLLPQVAVAQGWDGETFLAETCKTAGLEGGAWRVAGTDVEAFTAQVFAEA